MSNDNHSLVSYIEILDTDTTEKYRNASDEM